jgi:hypothetical protein
MAFTFVAWLQCVTLVHAFQAMNIRVRMRYVVRTLMWTHGTRVNMLHMRAGDAYRCCNLCTLRLRCMRSAYAIYCLRLHAMRACDTVICGREQCVHAMWLPTITYLRTVMPA